MEHVGRGRYIIDNNFCSPICFQELSSQGRDNLLYFGQETHHLDDPKGLAAFLWDSSLGKFRFITNFNFFRNPELCTEPIKLDECFFIAKASLQLIDAVTTPRDEPNIIINDIEVLFSDGSDLLRSLVREYHDYGGVIVCATNSDTSLRPPEYKQIFDRSPYNVYGRGRSMDERVSGHISIAAVQKDFGLQTINLLATWNIEEDSRIVNKPISPFID